MRLTALICLVCVSTHIYARIIAVPVDKTIVFGFEKGKRIVYPDDTLILASGTRGAIAFVGLHGTKDNYITILNAHGQCIITSATQAYGISLRGCSYIRLCGTGDSAHTYGIKITHITSRGAGLGVSDTSSDIEVSHVEIGYINGPGILCKTDPTCVINRDNFTMYNTVIHNTYIHNTATEGMYIGNSAYAGEKLTCHGQPIVQLAPVLNTVKVYDNKIDSSGWDGIQISNAIHVQCYNNTITHDSRRRTPEQMSGIMIGGGTTGQFYNNTIANGYGNGIECFGNDTVVIHHNTININDTLPAKCAVYINDKLANPHTVYIVESNTGIVTATPTVKTLNRTGISTAHIRNNDIGYYKK